MRSAILVGIGVIVGLSLAGLGALLIAKPKVQAPPQRELRPPEPNDAAPRFDLTDSSEPSGNERPGLKDRRSPAPPTAPWLQVQANLVPLNFLNRDGKSLPETLGILVAPEAGLCLVTTRAIAGAAFARAIVDDMPAAVRSVHSQRDDLGLALLQLDLDRVGSPIATEKLVPGQNLLSVARTGIPHLLTYQSTAFDPGLMREVIELKDAVLPNDSIVLINEATAIQAMVMTSSDGPRAVEISGLDFNSFTRIDLSLAHYEQRFFAGSGDDHLAAAQLAFREQRFADAIQSWRRLLVIEPFRRTDYEDDLEAAWRALLSEQANPSAALYQLLREALTDLPGVSDWWRDLGRVAAERELYSEALSAYQQLVVLDASRRAEVHSLRGELYYRWAQDWLRAGRSTEVYDLLYRALEEIRDHAQLWLLFGQLSERRRDYAAAASSWRQASALEPALAASLAADIDRAERLMAGPGRYVLDYDPRSRSMLVQLSINGRAVGEFIVDTGATVSMVPERLAKAAGLDLSARVPRVRLDTAGASRILPYSPTNSLELGGLRVEGLSVVVGNLSANDQQGLLGMDFLQNFHLENDTTNGRLVLSTR